MSKPERDYFLADTISMQTQPLNMTISPQNGAASPLNLIGRNAGASSGQSSSPFVMHHSDYHDQSPGHGDVLDLSRSRSDVDSEADFVEAIEEENEVLDDDDNEDYAIIDNKDATNYSVKDQNKESSITSNHKPWRLDHFKTFQSLSWQRWAFISRGWAPLCVTKLDTAGEDDFWVY